mgnify:CR=1 FL=1
MLIKILCATQCDLIWKQIILIKFIAIFFKNNLIVYINSEIKKPKLGNLKIKRINMDDSLFDFSRFNSGLQYIKDSNSIIFGFNDTLGNGRKLNFPLFIYILLSIFLINKNKIDISCPIDENEKEFWMCPYFFIGNYKILKSLNWIDHKKGIEYLTDIQIKELKKWINNGWRRSDFATDEQKHTKYLTLILERTLLIDKNLIKIRKFSKKSIYRKLNSIFPI